MSKKKIKPLSKKKKYFYIYCIHIKKKDWYYIGQRHLPNKYNKTKEDKSYLGSGKIICNYKNKYGIKNLIKTILIEGWFTQNQINKLEIQYIKQYRNKYGSISNKGKVINIASGGTFGDTFSYLSNKEKKIRSKHLSKALKGIPHGTFTEEHRKNLSNSKKKHYKPHYWFNNGKIEIWAIKCPKGFKKGRIYSPSKELREKLSINNSGKGNPNYGKHHSEKTRRKISKGNKGKKHSKKTIKKLKKSHKGFKWYNNGKVNVLSKICPKGFKHGRLNNYITNEIREKMSKSNKGKQNGMYGKKHSKKTRKKISKALTGRKIGHWYTNGTINICTTKCPKGFKPGKVDHKKRKKYKRKN